MLFVVGFFIRYNLPLDRLNLSDLFNLFQKDCPQRDDSGSEGARDYEPIAIGPAELLDRKADDHLTKTKPLRADAVDDPCNSCCRLL